MLIEDFGGIYRFLKGNVIEQYIYIYSLPLWPNMIEVARRNSQSQVSSVMPRFMFSDTLKRCTEDNQFTKRNSTKKNVNIQNFRN